MKKLGFFATYKAQAISGEASESKRHIASRFETVSLRMPTGGIFVNLQSTGIQGFGGWGLLAVWPESCKHMLGLALRDLCAYGANVKTGEAQVECPAFLRSGFDGERPFRISGQRGLPA